MSRDFRFCDSFRDAASSACRNFAEGFCRYEPGDIAQFFRYALASLGEVQDHLEKCRSRRFVDQAEFERLWDIAEHARATALNFMKPHQERVRRKRRPRPPRR